MPKERNNVVEGGRGAAFVHAERLLDSSAHNWHPIHRDCCFHRILTRTQAHKLRSPRLDDSVLQFGGVRRLSLQDLHHIASLADHASGGPYIHRNPVDPGPDLDLVLEIVAILSDLAHLQQIRDVLQVDLMKDWDHQVISTIHHNCEVSRRFRFVGQCESQALRSAPGRLTENAQTRQACYHDW